MRIHELEVLTVLLSDIQQHPQNPHNGDVESISESMEVNGLYKPILVQQSTGYILAGNHTYMAALAQGLHQMPVIYLDVTDAEAKRIMVADNATSRRGNDDPAILADVLQELYATDPGLGGTGFDYSEFERLNAELNAPMDFTETAPTEDKVPKATHKPLSIFPNVDPDGSVHEFTLSHSDFTHFSEAEFRQLRAMLGMEPLSRDEIREYEVEDWGKR